jgi:hypothetical protein
VITDERAALAWHLLELLLVLSVVGVIWSIRHQRPRYIETKRPVR